MRVLRIKHFLDSTIEGIDEQLKNFLLIEEICVGNYIDYKIYKNGSVYQTVLIYAKLLKGDKSNEKDDFIF